jgi:hypothetical protein
VNIEELKMALQLEHENSDLIDWSLDLVVCHSAAGYYLGMEDAEGPVARFSEYYLSSNDVRHAVADGSLRLKLSL